MKLNHAEHFRQVAYRITPHFDSIENPNFNMLQIADEVADYIEAVQTTVQTDFNHDVLVNIALNLDSVMYEVVYDKKLSAIKKFREITSCGLKAAKDVIEDERVWSQHGTAVPQDPQDVGLDALREKLSTDPSNDPITHPDHPWYTDNNNEESN